MSTLGERIKGRRKDIGLTQGDLAGEELSSGMISLIERDLTNPSLRTLEQLAIKLGVSVNYLLNQESMNKSDQHDRQVTLNMIKSLMKSGKFNEAEKVLMSFEKEEIEFSLEGFFYKLKGELFLARKDYRNAAQYFENTLIYLNPFELDEYIDVYYHLANCCMQIGEYRMSIEWALKGLLLLQSTHASEDTLLRLKLLYVQAYSYCRVQEFKKGLQVINIALGCMQETNCYYNEGLFSMLSGLAYLYMKEFHKGIEMTEKALRLIDSNLYIEQVAGCLTNLGIMYRHTGNFDQAINCLEHSLKLSIENDLCWSIENNYFELAYTLYEKGELITAQNICEEQIVNMNDAIPLKIKMILLLSHIKFDQEEYGESLIYVNNAENKAKKTGNAKLVAKSCILKSKILHKQHSYVEAFDQLLKSINIYEETMDDYYDNFPSR